MMWLIFWTAYCYIIWSGINSLRNINGDEGGQGKIVGGVGINISDAPYQVAVQLGGSMVCGGVILSSQYVATAAHCFAWNTSTSYFSVRGGTTDHLLGGWVHAAEHITIHPQYDDVLYDYDIALIRVDPPLEFDENTKPIAIYEGGIANGTVTITGWGTTGEDEGTSRYLQAVTVPVVPWDACNQMYAEYGGISDRMLCAGTEGEDSCYGDSGGPVVYKGELGGLVSWAAGCARPRYPGVNTQVNHPHIRQFIFQIAGV